jgi:predicted phosphodiesterase
VSETPWYQDRARLVAAVDEHGSCSAAARAIGGVSVAQVTEWWRRHGLPQRGFRNTRAASAPPVQPVSAPEPGWLIDALKRLGDEASVEQIADHADLSPKRVREALDAAGRDGYRVQEAAGRVVLERAPLPTHQTHEVSAALFDGDEFAVGLVSDTHICSVEERVAELHAAYDVFEREGIREVWHGGDLVAGSSIYRHQVKDLKVVAYEQQVEKAVNDYPLRPGIRTKMISGNHDLEGAAGQVGADPVAAFAYRRDDIDYLGQYSAYLTLPQKTRIHLLHPMKGSSYAVSYQPQKHAEAYQGGRKPHATLFGHWHRRGDFTWRGINCLLLGCFEGQTDLARRAGLGEPAVGFHILRMRIADDGTIVRWEPSWYPFFHGRTALAA